MSHEILAHPELGDEEHHAHRLLTDHLRRRGFEVTAGAYGLDTAFDARPRSKVEAGRSSSVAEVRSRAST